MKEAILLRLLNDFPSDQELKVGSFTIESTICCVGVENLLSTSKHKLLHKTHSKHSLPVLYYYYPLARTISLSSHAHTFPHWECRTPDPACLKTESYRVRILESVRKSCGSISNSSGVARLSSSAAHPSIPCAERYWPGGGWSGMKRSPLCYTLWNIIPPVMVINEVNQRQSVSI